MNNKRSENPSMREDNRKEKKTTRTSKVPVTAQNWAKEYQELMRQIKDLEARAKPLKQMLLAYAESHRDNFDEAFQIKFPNGTYVALRVQNYLNGTDEQKQQLIERTGDKYLKTDIDEKRILTEILQNEHLQKLCTQLKLTIAQKETMAVYAG